MTKAQKNIMAIIDRDGEYRTSDMRKRWTIESLVDSGEVAERVEETNIRTVKNRYGDYRESDVTIIVTKA